MIVAGVATAVGLNAYCLRRRLPLPAKLLLAQTTLVGYCVAAAASTRGLSQRTTGLLGKNESGSFRWWSFPIFWPYHFGLGIKLWAQQTFQEEPFYNAVGLRGW